MLASERGGRGSPNITLFDLRRGKEAVLPVMLLLPRTTPLGRGGHAASASSLPHAMSGSSHLPSPSHQFGYLEWRGYAYNGPGGGMPLDRVANVRSGVTRIVHLGARQLFLSTRERRNQSGVPTRVSPRTVEEHREAQRRAAQRLRENFEQLHQIAIRPCEVQAAHGQAVFQLATPQFHCSPAGHWWRKSRCVIAVGEDWRTCEMSWAAEAADSESDSQADSSLDWD